MTDAAAPSDAAEQWHKTACILCSNNCGVEVRLDGRQITRVRRVSVAASRPTRSCGIRRGASAIRRVLFVSVRPMPRRSGWPMATECGSPHLGALPSP